METPFCSYTIKGVGSMCITYESVYRFAETREVTVTKVEIAEKYERVHFVGHALWSPNITKEQLLAQAGRMEDEIETRLGYRAFLVDIQIKHFPPFTTDVDFIIDVPVIESLSPLGYFAMIAILAVCAVVFAFIVWLFWTTWLEYDKIYVCDQDGETPFSGNWVQYQAHLAEKHPTKYQAIKEAQSGNWWAQFPEMVKWVVGGVVVFAAIGLIATFVRRR